MGKLPIEPRPCLVCEKVFTPEHDRQVKLCSRKCRDFRVAYYYNPKARPKDLREAWLWEQLEAMFHYGLVEPNFKGKMSFKSGNSYRDIESITLTEKGKKALGRDEQGKRITGYIQTIVNGMMFEQDVKNA